MKLVIVRHGDAEPASGRDFDRNLTDRGRNDIAKMCELLRATDWRFSEIRTSPLVRARQTSEIISNEIKKFGFHIAPVVDEALSPGLDLESLMSNLTDTSSNASIWIFHAPDLQKFISYLVSIPESALYMTPGTMAGLNLISGSPAGRSMLVWIAQPEMIDKILK